jgi:hypothetical protein
VGVAWADISAGNEFSVFCWHGTGFTAVHLMETVHIRRPLGPWTYAQYALAAAWAPCLGKVDIPSSETIWHLQTM